MGYVAGVDRQQQVLLPEAIDDFITQDNPVRFLDAWIGTLDLAVLGFSRSVPAATGRPAYAPGDLLRLYVYGYLHRIRSSRRLEAEAQRNVELMWLLKRLTPDFKTIADFRKDNPVALRGVCREFTLLCKKLELFSGELIAIDGSKFRAVNAKDRNFTHAKLTRLLQAIEEKINDYLQALDTADQQEASLPRADAEALKAKIESLRTRKQTYETIQAQLQASGEEQISLTDAESRSMKTKGGTEVCYNVQIAVDERHKLIVAEDVTNEATDDKQLSPMACQAKEVLQVETLEAVADQGYYYGAEVKRCEEAGITAYVPKPRTSTNAAKGLYTKEDFRYDKERDCYVCPAGEILPFRFETVERGRGTRYYSTQACKRCAFKSQCTRNKQVRRITRWTDEHLLDAMEERLKEKPERMQQRKQLCEHPFGTMKRGMDAGYFLMKGLGKVRAEFSLTVLAYNLKRVLNLIGVDGLLTALDRGTNRPSFRSSERCSRRFRLQRTRSRVLPTQMRRLGRTGEHRRPRSRFAS